MAIQHMFAVICHNIPEELRTINHASSSQLTDTQRNPIQQLQLLSQQPRHGRVHWNVEEHIKQETIIL